MKSVFFLLFLLTASASVAVTKYSDEYCECGPYVGLSTGFPTLYGNVLVGESLDEADRTWALQLDGVSFYGKVSGVNHADTRIAAEIKYSFDFPQHLPMIFIMTGPGFDTTQSQFEAVVGGGLWWYPFIRSKLAFFLEFKKNYLLNGGTVYGDKPVLIGITQGL